MSRAARDSIFGVALAAALAGGCGKQAAAPAPVATVAPPVDAGLAPPVSRARRRMNIDQLDASIRRATGLGWEANGQNLFEQFAPTLGKPDFVERTREDLDPSPIFQKFLDDAARSVCDRLVKGEPGSRPADRVLFTAVPPGRVTGDPDPPAAVDANLRALILRFHGRKLAAGAPELDGWRWLYQSAYHVSASPEQTWRTICVGMITHPDFYLY